MAPLLPTLPYVDRITISSALDGDLFVSKGPWSRSCPSGGSPSVYPHLLVWVFISSSCSRYHVSSTRVVRAPSGSNPTRPMRTPGYSLAPLAADGGYFLASSLRVFSRVPGWLGSRLSLWPCPLGRGSDLRLAEHPLDGRDCARCGVLVAEVVEHHGTRTRSGL